MKKNMNRKGFTLIEMMIVIAIIAVLVAVIVPTVTGSTDKAAAATNAANLRGVEGEIVSMMLLEPDAFGDHSDEQAKIDGEQDWRENRNDDLEEAKANLTKAQEELEAAKDREKFAQKKIEEETENYNEALSDYNAANAEMDTAKSAPAYYAAFKKMKDAAEDIATAQSSIKFYETIKDGINTGNEYIDSQFNELLGEAYQKGIEVAEESVKEFQKEFDKLYKANQDALDDLAAQEQALYELKAVNGVITLDNGTTIQAPVSKKVNKDAVNVDKDVEMVVYVNNTTYEAYAYYKGDKMYQSSDFAAVAGNED